MHQLQVDDIDAEFLLVNTDAGLSEESDSSTVGHTCASKIVAVAAMFWAEGDGPGGAFEGGSGKKIRRAQTPTSCILCISSSPAAVP